MEPSTFTLHDLRRLVQAFGGRQMAAETGISRTTIQSALKRGVMTPALSARLAEGLARPVPPAPVVRGAVARALAAGGERAELARFVQQTGGVSATARMLGIPRQTLEGQLYLNPKVGGGRTGRLINQRVAVVKTYVQVQGESEFGEGDEVPEEGDPEGEALVAEVTRMNGTPLRQVIAQLDGHAARVQQEIIQAVERPATPTIGKGKKRDSPKKERFGGLPIGLVAYRIFFEPEERRGRFFQPEPLTIPWMRPGAELSSFMRDAFGDGVVDD